MPNEMRNEASQNFAQQAVTFSQPEVQRIILGAVLAIFLSALDQTITATALPKIAGDLGSFSQVSWIVTAYLLSATSVTLIAGKLSDLYGRRLMLRVSIGLFVLGSVMCALSPTMLLLIIGRGVQGLGGGAIFTVAQTIVADVVSPRERGRYATYFTGAWAAAAVLGPTIGGFLTGSFGWPWIFWINVPLGILALTIADPALTKLTKGRPGARVDLRSVGLLTIATVLGLLVLSLGGKRLPWLSPVTLGLAAAAIVCGIAFWLVQIRAADPIIPPRFTKDPVIRPMLLASFIVYGGFVTLAALTPIYLQVALGISVSDSGLMLIPLMLACSVTSYFAASGSRRTGRYKRPPLVGLAFTTIGSAILGWFAADIHPVFVAILLCVIGGGMGPFFPLSMVAGQNAVEPRDLGAVSGATIFVRTVGSAFGVAAGSALILGIAAQSLKQAGAFGDLETLTAHALSPETRLIIAHAFSVFYGAAAAAMAVAFYFFSRVEDRELRGGPQQAAATIMTE